MTTEQKAKAYDELLIKAKQIYNKENDVLIMHTIEDLFPELAESEDERIRKELIKVFSNREKYLIDQSFGDITVSEALTWLEKQGEHANFRNKIQIGDKVTRNEDGVLVNLSQLKRVAKKDEKQGEQKSQRMISAEAKEAMYGKTADKVEPKFKVKYAGSEYNVLDVKDIAGVTYYVIEDEPNHIDYVKANSCEIISGYAIKENGSPYPTKPAVFSEQKPADKVEPNDTHEYFSDLLEKDNSDNIADYAYQCAYCMSHDWIKDTATWEDVQKAVKLGAEWQKQKSTVWSEEDEVKINRIVACLENLNVADNDILLKDVDWLKSLRPQNWTKEDKERYISCLQRLGTGNPEQPETINSKWFKEHVYPQPTWKPSDEQMHAFEQVYDWYNNNFAPSETLTSLYKDLEKLKGE